MELEDETYLMASQPRQLSIVHLRNVLSVYEGSSRSSKLVDLLKILQLHNGWLVQAELRLSLSDVEAGL